MFLEKITICLLNYTRICQVGWMAVVNKQMCQMLYSKRCLSKHQSKLLESSLINAFSVKNDDLLFKF